MILIFIPPGCTQLTSSGLSNLIQLRQLEELELTNCPGSSKELIGYLRDNLSSTLVVEWTFPGLQSCAKCGVILCGVVTVIMFAVLTGCFYHGIWRQSARQTERNTPASSGGSNKVFILNSLEFTKIMNGVMLWTIFT